MSQVDVLKGKLELLESFLPKEQVNILWNLKESINSALSEKEQKYWNLFFSIMNNTAPILSQNGRYFKMTSSEVVKDTIAPDQKIVVLESPTTVK